jgi:hypothetical protein
LDGGVFLLHVVSELLQAVRSFTNDDDVRSSR